MERRRGGGTHRLHRWCSNLTSTRALKLGSTLSSTAGAPQRRRASVTDDRERRDMKRKKS
ncbi:Hypothetical predicted protein [Olea europaea subsp. europaea]|uniref:Uncharacterized protein n=1 Tax=Olea europaea subsp. europaea TaxID=158383 RepID=A0A8S0QZW7_OLEEU|nr:Hypothetical predicted protein [Olea europaea subsp. europaea]